MNFCTRHLLILLSIAVAFSGSFAQEKKRSTEVKKPVTTAVVRIKGDASYAPPIYPSETDDGIWNEFQTDDGRVKVTFPSPLDKLHRDSKPVEKNGRLLTVSAFTKHGSYKAYTRPVAPVTDNRDLDDVLERSIQSAFGGPGTRIRQMKTVHYNGVRGKEFVAELKRAEDTYLQYIRTFILGNQMVLLVVAIDNREDEEKMRPWIMRFFDSLSVEMSNNQVT